ncbi:MAG: NUDIX hydrolase [archaeon]
MSNETAVYVWVLLQNPAGKILLLRRHEIVDWEPNKWQLPGGHMKLGESPEQTAKRKVKDETGLSISKPTLIEMGIFPVKRNRKKFHAVRIMYRVPVLSKNVKLSVHHSEHEWVSLAKAKKMKLVPHLKEFLAQVKK